jgi:hypothetical protein
VFTSSLLGFFSFYFAHIFFSYWCSFSCLEQRFAISCIQFDHQFSVHILLCNHLAVIIHHPFLPSPSQSEYKYKYHLRANWQRTLEDDHLPNPATSERLDGWALKPKRRWKTSRGTNESAKLKKSRDNRKKRGGYSLMALRHCYLNLAWTFIIRQAHVSKGDVQKNFEAWIKRSFRFRFQSHQEGKRIRKKLMSIPHSFYVSWNSGII